jgi:hypothetical protein
MTKQLQGFIALLELLLWHQRIRPGQALLCHETMAASHPSQASWALSDKAAKADPKSPVLQ